jgi:cysteine-rich repeat protein
MVTTPTMMDAAQAASLKQAIHAQVDPEQLLTLARKLAEMAITLTLMELDNQVMLAMTEPNSTTMAAITSAKLRMVIITYLIRLFLGWYCEPGSASDTSTPTVCYEECNDGLDFGTFDCDTDGDTSGCIDGVVTAGWECAGGTYSSPDTCVEVCGDGYHYFEDCDDGNYFEYDGCDSYCEVEDGFYFASGYENAAYDVAHKFEETCDALDYGYLECDCGDYDSSSSGSPGCEGCSHCNVMGGYRC